VEQLTDKITLTPALEDYLEVIFELYENEGTVRVTDVAEKLNIAKSTVSQTINKLKTMGLVTQDSYGPIVLTSTGKECALKVQNKHRILRKFFVEVLGVDYKIAEKDACLIEHVVSPQLMEKLSEYIANLNEKDMFLDSNQFSGIDGKKSPDNNERGVGGIRSANTRALNELQIGEKGRVIRLTAKGSTRRRILDMGVTPGTEVTVKGVAPLGDPMELLVKGYRLSLRKEEAADVLVEVV
jgi:DtxR family Mn-dependent transcriptional regulator